MPIRLQRDRQQPGGDLLARSHHGVIFPRIMQRRGVAAPIHQLVGLAGHGRNHDGDLMAGIDLAFHMPRDIADAVELATDVPPNFMTRRPMMAGLFP